MNTRLRSLTKNFLTGCHIGVRAAAVTLVLLAAPAPAGAAEADPGAKVHFNIPAGPAADTLKRAAQQAGLEIVFPADLARGVKTAGVDGDYAAADAIAAMLKGTSLVAVFDQKSGSVTIQRAMSDESGAGSSAGSGEPAKDAAPKSRSSAMAGDPAGVAPAVSSGPAGTASDPLVLSPFKVNSKSDGGRYEPTEATSGGRVALKVFDSSQSISVISNEVIADVGAGRVLDAMKFVPGVSESSIPNGLDRVSIRGFLTTSRTLDGITTQYSDSQGNIDPFIVERMEIVKGPNSILAPAANPGGTINNISKQPFFYNSGTVSAEVGEYSADRVEMDVNRVVDPSGKLAIRLLAADEDDKDYYGSVKHEHLFAPMFTYRFSPTTEVTWQTHYIDERELNYYDGISIDPTAGTANRALLYQGVPTNLNIYGPDSYRNDGRVENTLTFLTRIADLVSLSVHARHSNEYNENNSMTTLSGSNSAAGTNANSFNPYTGLYTPGIVYSTTAPYTATPVAISPLFNRSGSRIALNSLHDTLQTDLHNEYKTNWFRAETLLGYSYTYDRGYYFGNALTAPAVTLTNFVYSPDVVGAVNRNQQYYSYNNQVYTSERVYMLDDRLILDGGYSRNQWRVSIDDQLQGKDVLANPSVSMVNFGAVAKPLPNVSVYYDHSQDAAILPIANIATAPNLPLQDGTQDEEGIRWLLGDGRLRLTASHYEIEQNNTNVSNPANFAYPPPVPALPGLLTNRTARGWEFEAQGSITDDLSVVGGYTNFRNRNPFGQIFRGTAERAASALFNYSFDHTSDLKGLALTVGVDYLCKRPGDDATGFTPLGVPHNSTFYLPARTLVNLGASYRLWGNWMIQLYVDNALNQKYLLSSLARGTVWAGTPIDLRAKFGYKF